MKVIVTGAAGFIGSALCRLLNTKHYVVGIDPAPFDGSWNCMPDEAIVSPIEFLDLDGVLAADDIVFHFGSPNDFAWCDAHPNQTIFSSVMGTANVFSHAQHVGAKVVFATTSSTGDNRMLSMYATSKRMCEDLAAAWEVRKLRLAVVRYWNVYGPGQRPTAVIPRMVRQAVRGEQLTVYGNDCHNGRDFVHVDDVNHFHLKLIESFMTGTHHLGSKKPVNIRQLAEQIADLAGAPPPRVVPPPDDGPIPSWPPVVPSWPWNWRPSIELKDGLRALVDEAERALLAPPLQEAVRVLEQQEGLA